MAATWMNHGAEWSSLDAEEVRRQGVLDAAMERLVKASRMLLGIVAQSRLQNSEQFLSALVTRSFFVPTWCAVPRVTMPGMRRVRAAVDDARRMVEDSPASTAAGLYLARLDELELELALLEALGEPKRVRALAKRRWGDGTECAAGLAKPLVDVACAWLGVLPEERETRDVSVADVVQCFKDTLRKVGLSHVCVLVEPRLVANAAVGDQTVFLADRCFGRQQMARLTVHEVLGHLVAGHNGRAQPLQLLAMGTAGSFADQEGLAIWLEEQAGWLGAERLRTLAARVVACRCVHEGRTIWETAQRLLDLGVHPKEVVTVCERAYRAGGVARDSIYLRGLLLVHQAMQAQSTAQAQNTMNAVTLEEMWLGKVAVKDMPTLRRLQAQGWVRPAEIQPAEIQPSLALRPAATGPGTKRETSPPSFLTSLTRLDAT